MALSQPLRALSHRRVLIGLAWAWLMLFIFMRALTSPPHLFGLQIISDPAEWKATLERITREEFLEVFITAQYLDFAFIAVNWALATGLSVAMLVRLGVVPPEDAAEQQVDLGIWGWTGLGLPVFYAVADLAENLLELPMMENPALADNQIALAFSATLIKWVLVAMWVAWWGLSNKVSKGQK